MKYAYTSYWRSVQTNTFSLTGVIVAAQDDIVAYCPEEPDEQQLWDDTIAAWRKTRDPRKPLMFLRQIARTGNGITDEYDGITYVGAASLEEAKYKAYERTKHKRGLEIQLFKPHPGWNSPLKINSTPVELLPNAPMRSSQDVSGQIGEFKPHLDTTAIHALHLAADIEVFPPAYSTNLPRLTTSFVGRDQHIQEIQKKLVSDPVLSIHGAAGCGKTRLAQELGHRVLSEYDGGVWLVDLASQADTGVVPEVVAQALGLFQDPDTPAITVLKKFLSYRRLLLILDNCDHMKAACVRLINDLLPYCKPLKILTISRKPLKLYGSVDWRIPSLSLPENTSPSLEAAATFSAVQLFVDRAGDTDSHFRLTTNNFISVVNVCQALGGIPLAIELVAAGSRSLSVEQVLGYLKDRFYDGYSTGERTATVYNVVEWSSDGLSQTARRLLWRLSVFASSWAAQDAQEICADGEMSSSKFAGSLNELAAFSLVTVTLGNNAGRYRMQEAIRQHGQERLNQHYGDLETVTLRRRYCEHFVSLAERIQPMLYGPERATWLKRLEAEQGNFRTALQYCHDDPDGTSLQLRLATALHRFCEVYGHLTEGRAYLSSALTREGALMPTRERGRALNAAGTLALAQGEGLAAKEYYFDSLADSENEAVLDKLGVALAKSGLGMAYAVLGDNIKASFYNYRALEVFSGQENPVGVANTLDNLGLVVKDLGDLKEALGLLHESLRLRRESKNTSGIASSLNGLGQLEQARSEYETARSFYEESLALYQKIGNKRGMAILLNNLGEVAAAVCDFAAARTYYDKSMEMCEHLGERQAKARLYINLGHLERWKCNYKRAEAFYKDGLSLASELKLRPLVGFSLRDIGVVYICQKNYVQAFECLEGSLEIRIDSGDEHGLIRCLEGFALLSFAQWDPRLSSEQKAIERMAQLFGAAKALREEINFPLPEVDEIDYQDVPNARFSFGPTAFDEHWQLGRSLSRKQIWDLIKELDPRVLRLAS